MGQEAGGFGESETSLLGQESFLPQIYALKRNGEDALAIAGASGVPEKAERLEAEKRVMSPRLLQETGGGLVKERDFLLGQESFFCLKFLCLERNGGDALAIAGALGLPEKAERLEAEKRGHESEAGTGDRRVSDDNYSFPEKPESFNCRSTGGFGESETSC